MKHLRFSGLATLAGALALLSGCVVAPIDPGPVVVYPARPAYRYAAPPVVVVPAPGYYQGHRRGYWR